MNWPGSGSTRRTNASRSSVAFLSFLTAISSLIGVMGIPAPAVATTHEVLVSTVEQLEAALDAGNSVRILAPDVPGIPRTLELTTTLLVPTGVSITGLGTKAEDIVILAPSSSPAVSVVGTGVTFENVTFAGASDRKAKGGAIAVQEGAELDLRAVSVKGNYAGEGGGLYNAGVTRIFDSVFYSNEAFGKGGAVSNDGTLTVVNSTFAKNKAGQGGAVSSSSTATFRFVTIVGNSSKNKIGAGTHLTGGTIELDHSIVANNRSAGSFYDCSGQTAVNYVIFSSTQGCQPNGEFQEVGLVAFELEEVPQDNGGPTKTLALIDQDGSANGFTHPAFEYGVECIAFDQRGVARPGEPERCSVGAYEPDLTAPTVTITPDSTDWATAPVTVSIVADDIGGSGIEVLYYTASGADPTGSGPDGIEVTAAGSSENYVVDADGITTISARAFDFDGNEGTAGPVEVRLDQQPPTVTTQVDPETKAVMFEVFDETSGVESLFVNSTPVDLTLNQETGGFEATVTESGSTGLLTFYANDIAGNQSTPETIDVQDPSVEIAVDATAQPGTSPWYVSEVPVDITASDNVGVVSLTYGVTGDPAPVTETPSGSPTTYAVDNAVTVSVDGTTEVYATAEDAEFNSGSATLVIQVDQTPPTVDFLVSEPDEFTGYRTVTLTPFDATSGVDSLLWDTVQGETPPSEVPAGASHAQSGFPVVVLVKDPGVSHVVFEAKDKAGNIFFGSVRVEIVGPTIQVAIGAPSLVKAGAVSATVGDITASLQTVASSGQSVSSTPFGSIPFGSIDLRDNPFGSIPFGSIPFGSIGTENLPFGSIPFGSIPVEDTPFGSIPFGSIPFGSIDFEVAPFGSIPFGSIPFGSIPFGSILLSELSTADGQSMDFFLQGISGFDGAPLQTLAFGDLLNVPFGSIDLNVNPFGSISVGAVPFGSIGLDPSAFIDCSAFDAAFGGSQSTYPTKVTCEDINPYNDALPTLVEMAAAGVPFTGTVGDVLGLDDVNVSSTSLGYLPFGSILLGQLTLDELPFGSIDTGFVDGLQGWCDAIGSNVCSEFGIVTDNPDTQDIDESNDNGQSLLSLALGGVDLGTVPFGSIPADLPFGSIPFGSIPFGSIQWGSTPFGSIAGLPVPICALLLVEVPTADCKTLSILDAYLIEGAQLSTATLADLEGWSGLYGYSLADLLLGFFGPASIPWVEAEDLNAIRLPEADRTPQPSFNYTITATIENLQSVAQISLELPPGFVPAAETAIGPSGEALSFTETYGEPLLSGEVPIVLTFDDVNLGIGSHDITMPVWAGVVLGEATAFARGSIPSTGDPEVEASTTVTVEQAVESTGFGPLLQGSSCSAASNLEVAHIVDAADVEVYQFQVPSECSGAKLEARLTNLTADLDLVLFGPPANGYLRGTPLTSSPYVEDHEYDLNPDDGRLDADVLADINTDPVSLGIPSTVVPIAVSANRDQSDEGFLARTPVTGGTYYLAVIGYNGAISDFPFGLQAQLTATATSVCFNTSGCSLGITPSTKASLPSKPLSPDVDTLFLYNAGWLAANAVAESAVDVVLSNPDWAALGVNAVAIPIDADPNVAPLLANWYGNVNDARFKPEAANDIVRAIGALLDGYLDPNGDDVPDTNVEYVVIVGPDEAVPHGRLIDSTFYSNETDHAPAIPIDGEVKAALAGGYILSDDPYGSLGGIAIADTEYFVPTMAVGRLVETWTQIESQLSAFLARGGVLDPDPSDGTFAAAAGYDFLIDGVNEIFDNLANGGFSVAGRLLNETVGDRKNGVTWTDTDLQALLGEIPLATVASINMHFDQYRALPSEGNATGNETTGLFTVGGDLPVLGSALMYSMGCHSGLNVSNLQIGQAAALNAWYVDWAEALTSDTSLEPDPDNSNLWIGNTGFGYGDSLFVAYSEALSASYSNFIGSNTVGRAWTLAKQDFASDLFVVSPYHVKSLNEWVLYGLPMYRTHASVPFGPSSVGFAAQATTTLLDDPIPGSSLKYAPYSLSATEIDLNDEGGWYSANGGSLQVRGRAAVALAEKDVTVPGYEPAGVIVTGLSSQEKPYSATIGNPVIETPDGFGVPTGQSLRYPAPKATFPAGIARLVDGVASDGSAATFAQFAASRFDPADSDPNPQDGYAGTMELFGPIDFEVYYRPADETDRKPPRFKLVSGVSDGSIAYFEVTAVDAPSGVHRVNVLFGPTSRTTAVDWTVVELARVPGTDRWVGGAPVGPEQLVSAFWAQACDTVGNCDASTAKGVNFNTKDAGTQEFVTVTVSGDGPTGSGWYRNIQSLTLTSTNGAAIDRYIIDGVEYPGGSSPLVINGSTPATDPRAASLDALNTDGGHYILAYDTLGNPPGAALIAVDGTDPVASIDSPEDNAAFAVGSNVTVTFSCTDALSGVATCEATGDLSNVRDADSDGINDTADLDTSVPGSFTVTVTATDKAGNTGTIGTATDSITFRVIDGSPPVVTIDSPADGASVVIGTTGQITFTCADADSGIASCTGELSANGGSFQPIGTSPASLVADMPGTYTIRVTGENGDGLTTIVTSTYFVGYGVCLDYNPNRPQPATGAVPIKLRLCDSAGNNISSPDILLTAVEVEQDSGVIFLAGPNDTGSANEDFLFRFTTDGYTYNLNTTETTDPVTGEPKPLGPGSYIFRFSASTTGDLLYEAPFKLK